MTDANDPITPHLTYNEVSGHANGFREGLTKREYFAAMAMSGLMANERTGKPEEFAKHAVNVTDALIQELNKTNQ